MPLTLEQQRDELARHLRQIFDAYERAANDPKARIPSYLFAVMLSAARAVSAMLGPNGLDKGIH